MRFTHALLLLVLPSTISTAGADLLFDLDAPGIEAAVEYEVHGGAYEDFPLGPDFETIDFDWHGTAYGDDLYAFTGSDGVEIFFGFSGTIDPAESFLLDFVYLSGVPTSHTSIRRVDVYTDNFQGNGGAIGQVLVDTPHLLVMEIGAGIHWNIPVYPDFTWDGSFLVTTTRTPEPAGIALLAFALLGFGALGRRRFPPPSRPVRSTQAR